MRLEGAAQRAHLVERPALDRGRHHRRGRLADGAPLTADAQVVDAVVGHLEVHHHLVTAERVEALDPVRRRHASSPRFRGLR